MLLSREDFCMLNRSRDAMNKKHANAGVHIDCACANQALPLNFETDCDEMNESCYDATKHQQ